MSIRRIEARDAEGWAAMRTRLRPHQDAGDLARETHAFADGGAATMLDAVFLAEDGEARPLGFLELSIRAFSDGDSMPVPHVEGWYVEAAARRRGIGRALMIAAEDWARARGFTELASDTELQNVASLKAHGGCGFEEVERLIKLRKSLAGGP
jgi:aminoglycoside 6'-N-acetyltransferase I